MKKIIILLFFIAGMLSLFAQHLPAESRNKTGDSLKVSVSKAADPLERFSATVKSLEKSDSYIGNNVDSNSCIELLQTAQQLKNDSLLAISYNWIGYYFYQSKGDFPTALEYYFKALPAAEKVKDKRRISSLYFDIASVYNALQNTREEFIHTLKGGENLPDKSSPMYDYMVIQFQRNMSRYYSAKNQGDSALYYAQAMTQTSYRLKSITYKLQAMTLLGLLNAKAGENELAGIYFSKALAVSDSIKVNLKKFVFYQRYIPFLFDNNRMEEAALMAEQMWTVAGQNNNLNFKLWAAGFKRILFDKLQRTDSAYYYSKIETNIKDLIFNQNNQNVIQALAFKEQIRLIEEEGIQKKAALQRKQNIQYALIALCIIVLFTLYLLLSQSFITNAKAIEFFGVVTLLIVFEFLNLLLHPFLERITHHSPVLMLLALVAIAALLVPLHHKAEKWATAKLVEKNKQIRLAAAKKTIEQLGG